MSSDPVAGSGHGHGSLRVGAILRPDRLNLQDHLRKGSPKKGEPPNGDPSRSAGLMMQNQCSVRGKLGRQHLGVPNVYVFFVCSAGARRNRSEADLCRRLLEIHRTLALGRGASNRVRRRAQVAAATEACHDSGRVSNLAECTSGYP